MGSVRIFTNPNDNDYGKLQIIKQLADEINRLIVVISIKPLFNFHETL